MITITVRKHDWQGRFRYAWQGTVAEQRPEMLVLDAVWNGPGEPRVGEMQFVRGDRFTEYYYTALPYAIWTVQQPSGAIKGWYCNIHTPPTLAECVLSFDDLLLDIVAYPDARFQVLDRDEFLAARAAGLSAERAALAEQGLKDLVALLTQGAPPFNLPPGHAHEIPA